MTVYKIIKLLHKAILLIAKANEEDLNKIGGKLAEIEKELVEYQSPEL